MNRILLKIKTLLVLLIFATSAQVGFSQVLMVEDFDYPTSDPLLNHGWVMQGTSTTNALAIGADNLTYTNYPLSAGKSVPMMDNGQDAFKEFPSQSTGNLYLSFLVKVTAAGTGDYFLSLKELPTSANTNFRGRVFVKADGTDPTKIYFGVNKGSNETNVAYTTTQYALNTTYLIVLKYSFVDGVTNDIVTMYVQPTIPGSEPASPDLTAPDLTASDFNLASVLIRQGTALKASSLIIDGIRVANTWTDATSDILAPVATIAPADAATNVTVNTIPTITFDEAIRKTDGSEVTNADLTTLVKFKKTNSIGEDVPCTMTIDAAKKVITITPGADLLNSQAYYIECGEVEDAFGNTGVVKAATFTTIAAATPTLTITAPTAGATFHAGDHVNITWTSANITNVAIDVYESGTLVTNLTTSTPAAAGTFGVDIPADAGYSAAYTIRISNADDAAFFVTSDPFTIIGVATSLGDLRTRFASGDVVKLTGEATVTFLRPANRNQKYIQDATAGLLIDDAVPVLTTTVAVGDNIKDLEGKLGLYGGVLQIVPTVATVTVASSGNTVTIPEVVLADYITNYLQYESELIKIKNVWFTAGDGIVTFIGSTNYDLTDGTSTIVFRTFKSGDGDIVGSVIPKNHFDGIFIGGYYNATVQLFGRNMADFTLLSSEKAITAFAFNGLTPAVNATIDETAKTIAATVPAGTDLTTLVPTITISAKATVSPESGAIANFTNPVVFTVTAEDGTKQTYTVTVSLGTGIGDDPQANMKMYPVPATDFLYLKNIESVKFLEVFNAAGVKIETVRTNGISYYDMPVESYKPGLYFIRFTSESGVFMKKFMKR